MIKLQKQDILKKLVAITGVVIFGVIFITHPDIASDGVKKGLALLGENLIPALFPFMIVSGYIAESPITYLTTHIFDKAAHKAFRTSACSLVIFFLGCLGGYPIGAKTINEFRKKGYISETESARLFNWCINPGISFVVTAVGTFMLGNTLSGIIIYFSCVAASIVLGIFSGFFCRIPQAPQKHISNEKFTEHALIKAVSSSVEAMSGICGWVLFFSTLCELCNQLIDAKDLKLLINAVAEVTLGCKATISAGLPLPVLCAVISFGGLAVASQIAPYLAECGVKMKSYICWQLAGSALSSFFCSQLVKFFPRCAVASASIPPVGTLTKGVPTALIMLLMCIVMIFEVDNKRKVC